MIPSAERGDEAARRRIRLSLDESLLVEAAAGAGKTTEMVERIANVLQSGRTTVERVAAVTFTQKAAGEMKLRLRQKLDLRRALVQSPDEAACLENALARLEEAAIGTIHAFCAMMLRERPVEARVDPDFEEIDESEARSLYAGVFRRWLQEKLGSESPGLRRALARLAAREERDREYTPAEQLEQSGWNLIEWRDYPEPWRRPNYDRRATIDQLAAEAQRIEQDTRNRRGELFDPLRELRSWIERSPRDYDMLEALLFKLHRVWKRNERRVPDAKLFRTIGDFRRVAEADLAAELRDEMWELVERYDQAKRRAGKLDFMDLLLLARNLIRDHADVRRYFQTKYTHLFVDEFQDTDPLQAEILLLLAADDPEQTDWLEATPVPGKLFLVGDPKQSIYKFRRADVHLYQMVCKRLTERGVQLLQLSRSFRSVRSIQQCVNAAFSPEMKGDDEAAQAAYVPLEEHRGDLEGQPAVIALPAPKPYGARSVTKAAVEASLPGAVAGFIEWLLAHSDWKVEDPELPGQLTRIRERHIAVLFRRFTNWGKDLTRDYARALEDRGIAHLLVGSKTFHWREEIETMRALLTAVEWPEDELAVYATLRGALFALPDHVLLRYRLEFKRLHPFREVPEQLPPDCRLVRDALQLLADLHLGRNRRPVAETVYRALEATRAWAAFAFRPAGHQALANVRRVLDLARRYESAGGISFRGFVTELNAQADRPSDREAPVLEEGAEGVRLMTVHAAKGLEFPIVILGDITANLTAAYPSRYVDAGRRLCAMQLVNCLPLELLENEQREKVREQAEGVRVAYVAATRARDLLVVPAVGDEEMKGWTAALNKAIYPDASRRRHAAPVPGCPPFGSVSVLKRPAEIREEISVRPGLHRPQAGEHQVVWWDPAALPQAREEYFGDRQKLLLSEDASSLERSLKAYQEWQQRRAARLERGRSPAVDLQIASEMNAPPDGWDRRLEVMSVPRAASRPHGRRFGTLLHGALRDVPLDAVRAQVEVAAQFHGKILGAPGQEIEAAAEAVMAALAHELLQRARAARRIHREFPISLALGERRRLEGVIDLAFEEDEGWVIADFKTDAVLDPLPARYQAQLAWYAWALERITQRPVRAYLLGV